MKWAIVLFLLNFKNCCNGDDKFVRDARLEDFPFTARLLYGNKFCQGALIAENLVVTLAHCLGKGSTVRVYLGFNEKVMSPGTAQLHRTQIYDSSEIYIHEDFEKITDKYAKNDLALIKLPSGSVEITNRVRPGKIIAKNYFESLDDKLANVSGWKNEIVTNKKFGTGHLLAQEKCTQFFGSRFLGNQELCLMLMFDIHQMNMIGNIVSIRDKIIGLRVEDGDCLVADPICRQTAIVLNLVPYLDWISEKSNVPVSEFSSIGQHIFPVVSLLLFLLLCSLSFNQN